MTTTEHNKYLGIAHLVYGSLATTAITFFILMFLFVFTIDAQGRPMPPEMRTMFSIFLIFGSLFGLAMSLPSLIAGFGLLKRKPWARTAGIVAGVMATMHFPLGTAVGVYTFWFLFGDQGKALYRYQARLQRPADDIYAPPLNPPDWR